MVDVDVKSTPSSVKYRSEDNQSICKRLNSRGSVSQFDKHTGKATVKVGNSLFLATVKQQSSPPLCSLSDRAGSPVDQAAARTPGERRYEQATDQPHDKHNNICDTHCE